MRSHSINLGLLHVQFQIAVEPKKWEWHSIWFQRKCIRVSRRFRYHTHYPGLSVHTGRHIISYQFQWKIFWTGHQWRSPANTDSGIWPKPLYQRSLEGERLFHFSRIKLHVFQSRWVSQGPPLYGSAYGWADIQKVQLLWSSPGRMVRTTCIMMTMKPKAKQRSTASETSALVPEWVNVSV